MFTRQWPAILTYHSIGDPPPSFPGKASLFVRTADFERQVKWLVTHGHSIISLDTLGNAFTNANPLPPKPVVLTFDDGFLNNYEAAFPILRKHRATATFFITTGCIGENDKQGLAHMTVAQIAELHRAGMEIGSHTVSHPWLARLPSEDARRELTESKATLERILDDEIRWLCYPSGSFSDTVIDQAREAGYAGACSVIRDNRVLPHQLYWMPRIMIMRDTPTSRFSYMFSWLYHVLHARKNKRRWKR